MDFPKFHPRMFLDHDEVFSICERWEFLIIESHQIGLLECLMHVHYVDTCNHCCPHTHKTNETKHFKWHTSFKLPPI